MHSYISSSFKMCRMPLNLKTLIPPHLQFMFEVWCYYTSLILSNYPAMSAAHQMPLPIPFFRVSQYGLPQPRRRIPSPTTSFKLGPKFCIANLPFPSYPPFSSAQNSISPSWLILPLLTNSPLSLIKSSTVKLKSAKIFK